MNTLAQPGAGALADALARRVLGTATPIRTAALPADLDDLAGRYAGATRHQQRTVTIERVDTGLAVRLGNATRGTPLHHLGDDVFAVINAAGQPGLVRFMFVRAADGTVTLHFDEDAGHVVLTRHDGGHRQD
jgi:hypothetical protein